MFSHATIGADDMSGATAFYDAVFTALGIDRFFTTEDAVAYGEPEGSQVWVLRPYDGNAAKAGNCVHIAFLAPDRASVRAFHAAALANGGSDEGAPGLRPHYHPNYYGAYVRDPEGNKIQAVCHAGEG